MSLFNPNPGLAIWTWITFAVLFVILKRYAFPALLGTMKERELMIAKAVDDAEAVAKQRSEAEADRDKVLAEARRAADDIVRRAREEAEKVRKQLTEKAEAEAEDIVTLARLRAADERKAAMVALQADMANLVCNASEQVIGKSFVGETERNWARELVRQV